MKPTLRLLTVAFPGQREVELDGLGEEAPYGTVRDDMVREDHAPYAGFGRRAEVKRYCLFGRLLWVQMG